MSQPCHYSVLGIKRGSTASEAKAAFRELAKKTHPDVAAKHAESSKQEAVTKDFHAISEAVRVLSDPLLKATYDFELNSSRNSVTGVETYEWQRNGSMTEANSSSSQGDQDLAQESHHAFESFKSGVTTRPNAAYYRRMNPRPRNDADRLLRKNARRSSTVSGASVSSRTIIPAILFIGVLGGLLTHERF